MLFLINQTLKYKHKSRIGTGKVLGAKYLFQKNTFSEKQKLLETAKRYSSVETA